MRKFYDDVAPVYDCHYQRPVDLAENLVTFAEAGSGERVLDLGCGTGLYLDYHDPLDYLGVDLSPGMVGLARAKYPARSFIVADALRLRLPPRYDLVVSTFGGMSHPVDQEAVARAVARPLRPGGRLFLQLCTPRYQVRRHYIARGQLPMHTLWPAGIRRLYGPYFDDLRVLGLNILGDLFPSAEYLRFEMYTLGRLLPMLAYFYVVMGVRNGTPADR